MNLNDMTIGQFKELSELLMASKSSGLNDQISYYESASIATNGFQGKR